LIDPAIAERIERAATAALLDELLGVLRRGKFVRRLALRNLNVPELFDGYAALVRFAAPAVVPPTILRDPADDHVLAAALGAGADLIVSGDADLLDLESFRTIPILTAAKAVEHCGFVDRDR
jgi:putative PIN family toxin of toxin-antitoxin system